LSPNRIKAAVKTTKSVRPSGNKNDVSVRSRSISQHSGQRYRSRSAHECNERGSSGAHRANCTAAQEIFQPFDVNQASNSALGMNSRRTSNEPASTRLENRAKKSRDNSIKIGEGDKSKPKIKKMPSSTRNVTNITPKVSNQRVLVTENTTDRKRPMSKNKAAESTGVSKTANNAKAKLKNLQNKKSNQRLAKLEKMYQELTEIEAKNPKM